MIGARGRLHPGFGVVTSDASDVTDALDQHGLVVLKGGCTGLGGLVDLASRFGALTPAHPLDNNTPSGFPEVHTISYEHFARMAPPAQRYVNEARYSATTEWHHDLSVVVNPPSVSVTWAEEVPPVGGATSYADMVAAYEALSEPMRSLADGLVAVHEWGAGRSGSGIFGPGAPAYASEHPVVSVLPSGRRALFVSPCYTSRIVGLPHQESQALLAMLFEHITWPGRVVRITWEAGDVVVADNRALIHVGPLDLDGQIGVHRTLHRAMVEGTVVRGPKGQESRSLAGEPFRSIRSVSPLPDLAQSRADSIRMVTADQHVWALAQDVDSLAERCRQLEALVTR